MFQLRNCCFLAKLKLVYRPRTGRESPDSAGACKGHPSQATYGDDCDRSQGLPDPRVLLMESLTHYNITKCSTLTEASLDQGDMRWS